MRAIARGVRDMYRSELRAVLVILLVALSLAVVLAMTQALGVIEDQTRRLGTQVSTTIEVRRAGAMGMGFGFEALPGRFFERAQAIPNAVRVERYLFQRFIDRGKPRPIVIVVGLDPGSRLLVATHGEVGDPRVVQGPSARSSRCTSRRSSAARCSRPRRWRSPSRRWSRSSSRAG